MLKFWYIDYLVWLPPIIVLRLPALESPSIEEKHFNSPKKAEDVAIAKKLAIPEKMEKATLWAVNTWDKWTKQRELSEDKRLFGPISISEMSEDQIRYWVPQFI